MSACHESIRLLTSTRTNSILGIRMSTRIPILVLGATGYIGGSVLARLLAHSDRDEFDITALVRSPRNAARLDSFGITTVIGTLEEAGKLEVLASQAHVVFSMADAKNLRAIQAILRGLRKRREDTGDLPLLIHNSGTACLNDDARGMYSSDVIYDDMKPEQIEALPSSQPHRQVDMAIVEADQRGYLRSYIILPSSVYGIVSGPLVNARVQNPYARLMPHFIRCALDRGQVGMVGNGVSTWNNVEIGELTDLYMILLETLLAEPEKAGHGSEGYYFAENGEHTWCELSRAIGVALRQLGISKNIEPTSLNEEEVAKYGGTLGGYALGTNARCRANRARALGWRPTKTTNDMLDSLKAQSQALIMEQQAKQQMMM
ncbi:unnamed protein product [Somion occarium]|uniref:NmrA-like domain-containing protein n=1 Tax=Somion occarium TaxID=3059160 RepID=A0ABP1D4N7_9APHY